MSIIIKPEIRKTSEIKYHQDNAPGDRYVFVDKKLFSKSEFYIIGRRVEFVPKGQKDYVDAHRHNCNSFYLFIGDNEDLSGLKAEVVIENNKRAIESPCSVLIPEKIEHTYKLINGKGWFIHIVLKPDYNSSLFEGEIENQKIGIKQLYKKFEKQIKVPKDRERPVEYAKKLDNPQRWILISPKIFPKARIYAALHQIFSDKPFELNQRLHSHYEDEVYLFFTRDKEYIEVNIYDSEDKKKKIKSPITVYHPKRVEHKYDYVSGSGFLLVVLKERIPGEGYTFTPTETS